MTDKGRFALVLALGFVTAAPAEAQNGPSYFVGAAVTMPTGDFNEYAKPGWLGAAGFTKTLVASRVWFGAEGIYGRNSHDDVEGDRTNLYGANGLFGINFSPADQPGLYIYGSVGLLVHDFAPATGSGGSDTSFAWSGAAGYAIPVAAITFWFEARYFNSKDTGFIPLMAGIGIGGGGGN